MTKPILQTNASLSQWVSNMNKLPDAYARATLSSLNQLAFFSRKNMQKTISTMFINRNRFTQSRVFVDMAKRSNKIEDMQSVVGHTQKYMAMQETGGTYRNSDGIATPTDEARTGRSYRKAVRLQSRLRNIKTQNIVAPTNKGNAVRNAIIIAQAKNLPKNTAFRLKAAKGKPKGIYTINNNRLRMLYKTQERILTVKKTGWFSKSIVKIDVEKQFFNNLDKEVEKL